MLMLTKVNVMLVNLAVTESLDNILIKFIS